MFGRGASPDYPVQGSFRGFVEAPARFPSPSRSRNPLSAGHQQLPGTHELGDSERPQQVDEGVELLTRSVGLEDQGLRAEVHHPGPVVLGDLEDLGTLVERAQDLRPDWPVGLLTAVALGDLTKLEVDFYAVATSIATRRFIRNVHGLDREVYVWTVNEPVQMAAMMGLGIDNIITDEPALARSVLEERAEMNQIERLILLIAGRFGIVPPREGPSTEADA